MDGLVGAQLCKQMRQLMILKRRDLADICVGCPLLEAGRKLDNIAL